MFSILAHNDRLKLIAERETKGPFVSSHCTLISFGRSFIVVQDESICIVCFALDMDAG
jgi:hypothetical protein